MKEIKEAYKEWRAAKDAAQLSCERKLNFDYAQKLGACQMFTGQEQISDLAEKLFSPKGIEFATTFDFPTIEIFRSFLQYDPQKYGFYIDAGDIDLTEQKRIYLVGDTRAKLRYSKSNLNRIVCMCGAKAEIFASGFSVIKAESDHHSQIEIHQSQKAQIL